MNLNLGCSDRHLPNWVNVDLFPPCDVQADLGLIWPWQDNVVQAVIAHDIIEHIADKTHFMNQLWRVMRSGARVDIITPDASVGDGFWQDPTHKAGWCMNSWQYYQYRSFAQQRFARSYGIQCAFNVLHLERKEYPDVVNRVWKIRAVLEAVKGDQKYNEEVLGL